MFKLVREPLKFGAKELNLKVEFNGKIYSGCLEEVEA